MVSTGGNTLVEVTYFIEVLHLEDGMTRTDGMIDARLADLDRISRSEEPVLTLETGESIPIIVTQIVLGHADIRVLGPMPRTVESTAI